MGTSGGDLREINHWCIQSQQLARIGDGCSFWDFGCVTLPMAPCPEPSPYLWVAWRSDLHVIRMTGASHQRQGNHFWHIMAQSRVVSLHRSSKFCWILRIDRTVQFVTLDSQLLHLNSTQINLRGRAWRQSLEATGQKSDRTMSYRCTLD